MISNPDVFALTAPFGVVMICLIVDSSSLGGVKWISIANRFVLGILGGFGFFAAIADLGFGLYPEYLGASALSASMLGVIVTNNIKLLRAK